MESVHGAALPHKSDPRWAALVTSGTTKPLKLLALKFTLMRMNIRVRQDPSPASVAKHVDELYAFFTLDPRRVDDDTATLFEKR